MPRRHSRDTSADSPFLGAPGSKHEEDQAFESDQDLPRRGASLKKLRFRLLVTLFAMILTVEMGMAMAIGPITRISEAIACREYYAQNDPAKIAADGMVKEEFCKVKDVQNELAAVKGYMEFFDGLLSILSPFPFGVGCAVD